MSTSQQADSQKDKPHLFPGREPSDSCYSAGCRCRGCKAEHARSARERIQAKIDHTWVDRRKTRTSTAGPGASCQCTRAEALLSRPETPSLGPGPQLALWLLARGGTMTVAELAARTRSSTELAELRLVELVDAGLAIRAEDGAYTLAAAQ